MTPDARAAAAIDLLDDVLAGAPAERALTTWARRSRFAGSKDRAAVRDIVFDCLRNRRSFSARSRRQDGRALVLAWAQSDEASLEQYFTGQGYGPAKVSTEEAHALESGSDLTGADAANLQDWVFDALAAEQGAESAVAAGRALSQRAPVDLRVNVARTTRDRAAEMLREEGIATEAVEHVPTALRVMTNPRRVSQTSAFVDGLVEIQDAASQAVALALPLSDSMRVLDLCAGGGGKSLAMAALAPGAVIDAWDISADRLAPLAERAKRAGAKVTLLSDRPQSAAYDLVLIDAPCSGSGAWRRSPEAKWRLTSARLAELESVQRDIMDHGWSLLRTGGTLAYATCSIFARENEAQVSAFLSRTPGARLERSKRFDLNAPGDGFFVAGMTRLG